MGFGAAGIWPCCSSEPPVLRWPLQSWFQGFGTQGSGSQVELLHSQSCSPGSARHFGARLLRFPLSWLPFSPPGRLKGSPELGSLVPRTVSVRGSPSSAPRDSLYREFHRFGFPCSPQRPHSSARLRPSLSGNQHNSHFNPLKTQTS